MFSGKNAQFEKLLEKATSSLLLEPDWGATLSICDFIRQAEILPKPAISAIRKRLSNENPHCVMYTLQVMESVTKNCGPLVHDEIATKETMDIVKDLAKNRGDPVKAKVLELIQVWNYAFRSNSKYRIVTDTYNSLKSDGYKFPQLREADAMFTTESAPEWKEGETCNRCRAQFGLIKRQHHCRNCGHTVCGNCSSKQSAIPRFGIEREVRVCDTCYDLINKTGTDGANPAGNDKTDELPAEYLSSNLAKEAQSADAGGSVPNSDRQRELEMQEKEELDLAIALSASEAETQAKERARLQGHQKAYGTVPTPANQENRGTLYSTLDTSEMDPELARYLNRNYWDSKSGGGGVQANTQPSAPVYVSVPPATKQPQVQQIPLGTKDKKTENEELASEVEKQQKEFLQALKSSVEIFVNRMRSNSQRGRSITSDTAVQTLFLTLNAMHPQLLHYIKDQEDNRTYYESLQDKLAQLRDAREALNALREENTERRRREQEELARIQHMQMMQKLEVMRQKKQEYLDYQRQLALQRMQEQDREMKQRLEQQKQMQQMRQYQQQYPYSVQQQPPQVYGQPAPYGSYQQPGSYQPQQIVQPGGRGGGYPTMNYQQPMSTDPQQSMPMGQQGYGTQQGYMGAPQQQQQGYNQTYDMQGMNQALPSGNEGYMPQQQAGVPPGNTAYQMSQQQQQPGMNMLGGNPTVADSSSTPQQQQAPPSQQYPNQPPQQSPGQPPQQQQDNQLISFD